MHVAARRPARAPDARRTAFRCALTVLVAAVPVLLAGCDAAPTTAAVHARLLGGGTMLVQWYSPAADHETVRALRADGSGAVVDLVPRTPFTEIRPRWRAHGDGFVYEVRDPERTRSSVWGARSDGSAAHLVAACPGAPCAELSWPAPSPRDGSVLVSEQERSADGRRTRSRLVLVPGGGRPWTVVASTPDGWSAFGSSSFSPDGTRVVSEVLDHPDDRSEVVSGSRLVVVRLGDADHRLLDITPSRLVAGHPRWHPTRDLILFASFDLSEFWAGERSDVYTVRSDGSGLRRLTHAPAGGTVRPGTASWTADGRIVASVALGPGNATVDVRVAWIDPRTGSVTVTERSGQAPDPQPSP